MHFRDASLPRAVVALIIATLFLTGCTTVEVKNYRAHPEFSNRTETKNSRVLAPADVSIKEISAGGVAEEIDEYSEEVTRMFAASFNSIATENGEAVFRPVEVPNEVKEEFQEAFTLAQTVMGDVLVYSYYDYLPGFEHKRKNFRYSVGDLSTVFDTVGADTMLLLFGEDHYTTAGRKAINGMLTLLSAASTGSAYIGVEGVGGVSAMLVDRDGEVIWLTRYFDMSLDLRKKADVDKVVGIIMQDMTKAKLDILEASKS